MGVEILVGVEDKNWQVLQDDELQFCYVVRMNPVFSRLSDEAGLASTSSTVTLDGVSASSDEVVELRKLNDRGIVVLDVKGLGLESAIENRLQVPTGRFLEFWLANAKVGKGEERCLHRAS